MVVEKQVQLQLVCEPMTVTQLSEKIEQSVVTIMMFLLKQGIVVAKNQLLTPEMIAKVAEFFEIELVRPCEKKEEIITRAGHVADKGKVAFERMPVVVVVGHVDHGKTTLLDFIRKTRVAAREKGGITQHIGAYEAVTAQGHIVFIDTPGHEAFSVVRARGVSAADVAILIVAADNGVQPQTLEALSLIQQAKIPLIVAINKVDKANQRQIDEVKKELSTHGLMPEDWGGETVYVPISALKGDGVDHLLEMIVLQAQMSGLSTYLDIPATGFVLESRFEKGRGAVATVICICGTVRVGDYFIAGMTQGRISSLKDSSGSFIETAKPSMPVQVAGFTDLPRAGDIFKVVSAEEMRSYKSSASDRRQIAAPQMQGNERAYRLIVKADTISSKEVLVSSLEKLAPKTYSGLIILSSGVGTISESDVSLAADTGAMIVGLHVKAESKAVVLAQSFGVSVLLFDIIYKLLEHMEALAEKGRPVKKVLKKVGEARILKVFDIKKLGIVAGAHIVEGLCNRTSTVKIYRANRLVGKGAITSLQRDRNSVKEVRKGFECAFMVDGFVEWQVDDRVECFNEIQEGQ